MDKSHSVYDFCNKIFRSKVFFGLEVFVSSVLGITLVFPIFAAILTQNEVLRFCFKIYLWLVYKDKIQLSDDECGSNYQVLPSKGRHTILYLGEIEGKQDVESLRENYQKHVIENKVYSKLTCIWETSWPYACLRKCETFDIKNHIRYFPGTEEKVVTEKELLQDILPELCHDMTDPDKPQWEEVIIPFYKRPEHHANEQSVNDKTDSDSQETISLRIIRIHHSYMDGASTFLMIANAMSGEASSFPYVIDPCKPLKISKFSMILYKLTCLALFSTVVIRTLLFPPFTRRSRFTVPFNSDEQILFGWTRKIPMDHFKSIKEKTGVSMPAIVTSVLASAIRNLEQKYPLIREEQKDLMSSVVPDSHPIWIVAGMFPYVSTKPQNKHTVIEAAANTTDISRVERLAMINDDLGRLAKNPMVTVFYWFHRILGRLPYPIEKLFLYMVSVPIVLSNVPLATRNIKLFGRECYSIVGWVPLIARTGLGVVSVRYADHFRYCLQADSSVMNQEQLDYFVEKIEEQVEELYVETAQLKRKISTESSLFDHGNDKCANSDAMQIDTIKNVENMDAANTPTTCINNNNLHLDIGHSLERSIKSMNYSFIYKLKDSLEHIREGIMKIKEQ